MQNYTSPKYDDQRKWIREAREHGITWEKIKYANKEDDKELEKFLQLQSDTNWWVRITSDEWKGIVNQEKKAEEHTNDVEFMRESSILLDENEDNAIKVPRDNKSAWILYKNNLLKQGFKHKVVNNIEKSSIKILKRLSSNTVKSGPIKGMVIGNVQSGKTSNMAALMAMAADWGWNLFIVLSGTIENLRKQTQTRLLNDLNFPGNLCWRGIEHPSEKICLGQRTQDLHFEDSSVERYFTVCIKNSTRLKDLIKWLQSDGNKQSQMKILVIDDEADQAGVNTADITNDERKTINKLIVNLVKGKTEDGKEAKSYYKAMNYIGYTATPYANVLNESSEESLYPRNFISTLEVSKEYFGPQQIFGIKNGKYSGMDIIRIINNKDLKAIKEIHEGKLINIPNSLKDSICWFLCGVAAMRLWKYKKPVSMLVHSSQKQDHHQYISDLIIDWLTTNPHEYILGKCEEIWKNEVNIFTFEKFKEQYPDYDRKDEEINRYPNFEQLKSEIIELLSQITNIHLGIDDKLQYHKGIHVCIDNCSKNGISDEGMHVRLAYPDSSNNLDYATAFIVIGGATLSRGLTIEGLISTYFLRSVGQADTLMQMGRWFGYRKGYELLPRLWITSKTKEQFEFLSELDEDLRNEIYQMDNMGIQPKDYGPKVKNTPKYSFIRITAKNKMQSATCYEANYTGASKQTYLFYGDNKILDFNIKTVEEFINKLGAPDNNKNRNRYSKNKLIWRNVPFDFINEMLKKYKFVDRLKVFNDIDSLSRWIIKVTKEGKLNNWNVIVSGNNENKHGVWNLKHGKVNMISRTNKNKDSKIINIGVLSNPIDVVSDILTDDKELMQKLNNIDSKQAKFLRNSSELGLNMTPQLIIYRIDGKSKVNGKLKGRYDLNLENDIVGMYINIPGGKKGTSYAESISINVKNNIFDDEGDLE